RGGPNRRLSTAQSEFFLPAERLRSDGGLVHLAFQFRRRCLRVCFCDSCLWNRVWLWHWASTSLLARPSSLRCLVCRENKPTTAGSPENCAFRIKLTRR